MTAESWSDRDERQYQRIRRTELELGKSEELAGEIAWRTVQMQRMADGRQETGDSTSRPRRADSAPRASP